MHMYVQMMFYLVWYKTAYSTFTKCYVKLNNVYSREFD